MDVVEVDVGGSVVDVGGSVVEVGGSVVDVVGPGPGVVVVQHGHSFQPGPGGC